MPVLVELIGELAEYERAHDEVEIDDMMLERALFGTGKAYYSMKQ